MDKVFGYRLAALRSEKRLTGTQLGNLIGVPKGTIAKWEKGMYYPNNDRLVLLADIFDVTTDYLMGRTDNKKSISVLTAEGEQIVNLNEFTQEQQELIKSMIKQFNSSNNNNNKKTQ